MKCGKPLKDEQQEYCLDCSRYPRAYDQGRSLWVHEGKIAQAIYQFKFHNRRIYADVFAGEMAEQYVTWIRAAGVQEILPVPLHPSKQRARGFNQAELLAQKLGEKIQIPVNANVLFRVRKTKPQKLLDERQREANLKNAFGVSREWNAPESVLVVDDIYTTGSTIHRIAKVLKKAGVQKVYFLTISIGQGL